MKKVIIFIAFFVLVAFVLPKITNGVNCNAVRCAECDKCGYCYASGQAPSNWRQCASCLYDVIPTKAIANENYSLEIKTNSVGVFEQVTPAGGKYFTQLGCINTGLDSFTNPSAAGGLLNFLLTRLIFPTVGVLSFLSLIYGAFLLITAQSNPEQIGKGKSYIVGAIVGLLFTLSVVLIINTIAGDVLRIPGFTRQPQLVITASSQFSTTNDGIRTNPQVQIAYNNKLIETMNFTSENNEVKDYKISIPDTLSAIKTITVTFTNDLCPRCQREPNGGDRNIWIKKITVDGKECIPSTYFIKDENKTVSATYTVVMYYSGTLTCSIN